jgi:hypothetical protein
MVRRGDSLKDEIEFSHLVLSGISVLTSGPTHNIRRIGSGCNGAARLRLPVGRHSNAERSALPLLGFALSQVLACVVTIPDVLIASYDGASTGKVLALFPVRCPYKILRGGP